MSDAEGAEEVGSLGEEAAKLLGALSGWAREQASEATDGLSGFAAHAAAAAHDVNEHLATGAAAAVMATPQPPGADAGDVEHIELVDEWPEDE